MLINYKNANANKLEKAFWFYLDLITDLEERKGIVSKDYPTFLADEGMSLLNKRQILKDKNKSTDEIDLKIEKELPKTLDAFEILIKRNFKQSEIDTILNDEIQKHGLGE